MLDACVYVLRSGCSWRMLPKDFPPWGAVYRTFRRWLARELRHRHGIEVEIVRHPGNRNVRRWHEAQFPLFPDPEGFVVLPKRWIIERTNAWNDRPRRLVRDHDRNRDVSTGWICPPKAVGSCATSPRHPL
jgi:transposase